MENIMIREDGVLFHIDYGFIFGNDSTVNTSIHSSSSATVRLDEQMIEGLGGSDMIEPFKKKCGEIYCLLRTHYHFICSALFRLVSVDPPIKECKYTHKFIETFITDRFMMGLSEKEAKEAFSTIIESNRGTLANKVSDMIHNTVTSIKESIW